MAYLLAGYGETTITPPLGSDLSGFGFCLDRRARSVLDDLKVRALFLKSNTHSLILISCDLLGFSVHFSDRIRREIAREQKLPLETILLACTHTHSGPASQPLPGLGRANHDYLRRLPQAVGQAVEEAISAAEAADFGFHFEAVEPTGFNRRHGDFSEIDPWLKVGIFRQKKRKIFLLGYACHPVTLGPTPEISSDWPGALAAEVEKRGDRAVVFQGFCGDIDPVCYLNRRLGATGDDIALCGRILGERAIKAESSIAFKDRAELRSVEKRISLPLQVFPKRRLDREIREAFEMTRGFPRGGRVARAWVKKVIKAQVASRLHPRMDNVPVQAMAIEKLKILGLPGEAFCSLGLKLRQKWPSLLTIGYANGNVGYLPTGEAYKDPLDYACYCAPKFYSLFPFSPKIESVLLRTSRRLLSSI